MRALGAGRDWARASAELRHSRPRLAKGMVMQNSNARASLRPRQDGANVNVQLASGNPGFSSSFCEARERSGRDGRPHARAVRASNLRVRARDTGRRCRDRLGQRRGAKELRARRHLWRVACPCERVRHTAQCLISAPSPARADMQNYQQCTLLANARFQAMF